MLNQLNNQTQSNNSLNQEICISKYTSPQEGGFKNLFEANFYRETRLAEEKQNSTLLSITLDKLIKAMAPLK